jgi:predicted HicB family RNase H-like nuclease
MEKKPMHQIQFQLNDQLYQSLQLRASASGFDSVNEYVVDVLENELIVTPKLDHLFTPERLAKIDRAMAQVKAGQVKTEEEVDEYLNKVRQDIIEKSK